MRSCTSCGCPLLERLSNCPFCLKTCALPSRREVRRMIDRGLGALLQPVAPSHAPPTPRRHTALVLLLLLLVLLPLLGLVGGHLHPRHTASTVASDSGWLADRSAIAITP